MKKLQIAAIAAAFAIVSTAAMAQTPAKPSDTQTPSASGAANSQMSGQSGMKKDQMKNNAGTNGSNAMDAQRGTQEPAKAGAQNPATKTAPGATREAN